VSTSGQTRRARTIKAIAAGFLRGEEKTRPARTIAPTEGRMFATGACIPRSFGERDCVPGVSRRMSETMPVPEGHPRRRDRPIDLAVERVGVDAVIRGERSLNDRRTSVEFSGAIGISTNRSYRTNRANKIYVKIHEPYSRPDAAIPDKKPVEAFPAGTDVLVLQPQ